jgi:hypothetical protein
MLIRRIRNDYLSAVTDSTPIPKREKVRWFTGLNPASSIRKIKLMGEQSTTFGKAR